MDENLGETITKELTSYGQKHVFKIQPFNLVSIDQRSDTHVSGSGGGGNAHRINPISISSKTIVTTNLFLRDANGVETYLQVKADVLARNGNKIYVITGFSIGKKNGKEGCVLCVYNATTDQSFWIIPTRKDFTIFHRGKKLFLLGLVLTGGWGLLLQNSDNIPLLYWIGPFLILISFIFGSINFYKECKFQTKVYNFCIEKQWISK